ncbi:MAG: tripartite tricarboxylate transporter substrate binding protein [Gammaproteobacteria bacterium]|nr:tripartite tricarboxylate transporter substrate binding protein [Gammaproteobacteria bacterium]
MDRKSYLQLAIAFAAALLTTGPATAQSWGPEKPVELIAASGPGGNTDRLARTIQRVMQEEKLVTTPVNVVNKTGGNQTVARVYLNQHPGDGHYLEVSNPTLIANNVMGLTPQQYTDFTPVALLLDEYTVFSVRADAPFKSGAELMQQLARQPDSLSVGLTTRGGANHVALALAVKAAGVDLARMKIVSFRSNGESMTALLGGHIDVVASSASPVLSHFKQGKIRVIAVSAPKRMGGALAQVPTWTEQKIAAVNSNWRLLIGPKGMQPAQVAYWEDVATKMANAEGWKQALQANFWEGRVVTGRALQDFMAAEQKKQREVLTELGLAK